MTAEIDHLIVGAPDLDEGVRWVEERLAARPATGGRHPDLGTRNALLSLGPDVYLEVLGPDPEAPEPRGPRPLGIDDLDAPRLVSWGARTTEELPALVERARAGGVDLGEVVHGSRARPDGTTLTWTLTELHAPLAGGVVPFFIDWGDTEHPARTAPPGGTLEGLRGVHPEPERVRDTLEVLGLEVPVAAGPRPELVAAIRTPDGVVEIR